MDMTTDLKTNLGAIKAECREAIKLSKKATAAPWTWRGGSLCDVEPINGRDDALFSGDIRVLSDGSARGEYSPDIDSDGADARFISTSRSLTPKLAQLALTSIEGMEELLELRIGEGFSTAVYRTGVRNILTTIVANWTAKGEV
jgi:hypothetical protein